MIFGRGRANVPPFHVGEHALPHVRSYTYLGVTLRQKLSSSGHVDELLRRGERKTAVCLSWTVSANLLFTFGMSWLEFVASISLFRRFQPGSVDGLGDPTFQLLCQPHSLLCRFAKKFMGSLYTSPAVFRVRRGPFVVLLRPRSSHFSAGPTKLVVARQVQHQHEIRYAVQCTVHELIPGTIYSRWQPQPHVHPLFTVSRHAHLLGPHDVGIILSRTDVLPVTTI